VARGREEQGVVLRGLKVLGDPVQFRSRGELAYPVIIQIPQKYAINPVATCEACGRGLNRQGIAMYRVEGISGKRRILAD